jgi:hypothetical protein
MNMSRTARIARLASVGFALLQLALAQTVSNDAVVKMVKGGLTDDLVIGMINSQQTSFLLSADDLIALKTNGVSDKVVSAMMAKKSGVAADVTVPAAAASPAREIGVYYQKGGQWTDVNPEVVSFKSGGVMKSMASYGIVKGDINGHLNGAHSNLQLKTPVELMIYVPEGIAATEYQLLMLHESGKSREFRTITGGVFHQSGGASRDAVEFEAKKIAPRTFTLTLSTLKSGEYGLLPPSSGDATGSTGRLGKLYTFHVIE